MGETLVVRVLAIGPLISSAHASRSADTSPTTLGESSLMASMVWGMNREGLVMIDVLSCVRWGL